MRGLDADTISGYNDLLQKQMLEEETTRIIDRTFDG